jgi:hypothetical protein
MTARRMMAVAVALLVGGAPAVDAGQAGSPPADGGAVPQAALPVGDDDPDRDPNPSQPDFTLVNLPTTLRVPKHSSAFRVTHRFTRPLGDGSVGELVEDLFGLDGGALIGLEYRFGLLRGLQGGILRTSDRTIQFFGQYAVLRQEGPSPIGIGILASIDGTNNFRDHYSPALGVALSRELGARGALHVAPVWVHDADPFVSPGEGRTNTLLVGLGARLRVRPTIYLIGEFSPRAGHAPGVHQGSVAIEKRAGGHVFQLNVSNGFANTTGQLARGGHPAREWFLGFNISRKFFR